MSFPFLKLLHAMVLTFREFTTDNIILLQQNMLTPIELNLNNKRPSVQEYHPKRVKIYVCLLLPKKSLPDEPIWLSFIKVLFVLYVTEIRDGNPNPQFGIRNPHGFLINNQESESAISERILQILFENPESIGNSYC